MTPIDAVKKERRVIDFHRLYDLSGESEDELFRAPKKEAEEEEKENKENSGCNQEIKTEETKKPVHSDEESEYNCWTSGGNLTDESGEESEVTCHSYLGR